MKSNKTRLYLLSITDKDIGQAIKNNQSLINGKSIKEYKNENKKIISLENQFFYYCNKEIKTLQIKDKDVDLQLKKKQNQCSPRKRKITFIIDIKPIIIYKSPKSIKKTRLNLASKKLNHFNTTNNICDNTKVNPADNNIQINNEKNQFIFTNSELIKKNLKIFYSFLHELCFAIKYTLSFTPSLKLKFRKKSSIDIINQKSNLNSNSNNQYEDNFYASAIAKISSKLSNNLDFTDKYRLALMHEEALKLSQNNSKVNGFKLSFKPRKRSNSFSSLTSKSSISKLKSTKLYPKNSTLKLNNKKSDMVSFSFQNDSDLDSINENINDLNCSSSESMLN